jgi:myo-inositol 2-dehydrogenase/D-chiro-inositol 1-dehydrogenase
VIRIGVIGTGVMGTDHARLLSTVVSGATLAAVFDIDPARAAAAVPGTPVYDDPHVLIRDEGVDAVLVASSDPTHEEYVLACLAAGKPVLCEKPLAPTVEGCQRILEAERDASHRRVSVGFMRRYDPGYLAMKSTVDSGALGAPLVLHCVHRNPTYPVGAPSSLLITGSAVHEIDIARWLLSEEIVAVTVHTPRRARAAGTTQDPQLILLETAGGVLVDVEVFVNARYGYDVRAELVCEEGTVSLDAAPETLLRKDFGTTRGLARDWRPRFAQAYRRELQDWVDGLRTDGVPRGATAWDGYVATVVAQAGVAALETGTRQAVKLDG